MAKSSTGNSGTAAFVITGRFESGSLLQQIAAAMDQAEKIIKQRLGSVGKELGVSLKENLKEPTKDLEQQLKPGRATKELSAYHSVLEKIYGKQTRINADIFTAIRRVVLWGAATRVIFDSMSQVQRTFKDIVDLNRALTDIAKLRPLGFGSIEIKRSVLQAAQDFGVSFKEVAETQIQFFQQGFNTAEVLELTRAQLLATSVAGVSAAEATEILISAMNVFNISAERSVMLVDKLQNVQANYAVSTQDLAAAMRRTGPIIEELGGSMDMLLGMITALKEATRKPGEYIGTALSMVLSRIITPIGEEALANVGVFIRESALTFRPLDDIMRDLASRWGDLNEAQKTNLALALGARHRYQAVLALMDKWNVVEKASSDSANSFGIALRAQSVEMTSLSRNFSIAGEIGKKAMMDIVQAIFGVAGSEAGILSFAKKLQGTFLAIQSNATELANNIKTTFKAIAYWVTYTVMFAGLKRLLLGIGAVTSAIKQFATLKAGLSIAATITALTGPIGIVAASLASLGMAIGLISSMKGAVQRAVEVKLPQNKLGEVYIGLGQATEEAKKTLEEYYAASREFYKKGGADALIKYRNILESVGNNAENVSLDQLISSIEGTGTSADKAKRALEELEMVIGFLKTTNSGLGITLEVLSSQGQTFYSVVSGLIPSLQRLATAGTDISEMDFFKSFFDISESDLKGVIDRINKRLSSFSKSGEVSLISFDKNAIENIIKGELKDLFVSKTSPFASLYKEAGNVGGAQLADSLLTTFETNVLKLLPRVMENVLRAGPAAGAGGVKQTVPEITLIPSINREQFVNDLLAQIENITTDKNVIDRITAAAKKNQIPIEAYIPGTGPSGEQFGDAIQNVTNFINSLQGKLDGLREDSLSKLVPSFEILKSKLTETTESMGYLAKKMSDTLKSLIQFNSESRALESSLAGVTGKARTLGKSILEANIDFYTKRVESGLELYLKAANANDAEIRVLQAEISKLEGLKSSIEGSMEAMKERGLQVTEDIVKQYSEARVALNQYRVDLSNVKAEQKELEAELLKEVKALQQLQAAQRTVNTTYENNKNAISAYVSAVEDALKKDLQFAEARAKITKDLGQLDQNNVVKALEAELSYIDQIYEARRRELALRGSFYKNENDLLKISEKQKSLQSSLAVDKSIQLEAKKFTIIEGINSVQQEQLDKLDQEYQKKRLTASIEYEQLAIEQRREKILVTQQYLLEEIKKMQAEISTTAGDYAQAFSRILLNPMKDFSEGLGKANFGEIFDSIFSEFGTAFEESISRRLQTGLQDVFNGISSMTAANLDQQIEELKNRIKSLTVQSETQQMAKTLNTAIRDALTSGGDYVYMRIRQALGMPIEGAAGSPATAAADISLQASETQIEAAKKDLESAKKMQFAVASIQAAGMFIGKLLAGTSPAAQTGTQIGGLFGSILAGSKATPIVSAAISAGMSIVGGLIGGILGKKEEEEKQQVVQVQQLQANNDALRENTEAVLRNTQSFDFMRRLINAPANFVLPAPALVGGGMPSVQINFNGPVGNSTDIGNSVYNAVSKAYRDAGRRVGRRG